MSGNSPYRIFDATLAAKRLLSPHMMRLTFAGADVTDMATHAPDQRIKLFFPHADGQLPSLPDSPDWYDIYRSVPPSERVPMRTYTIRHLRAARGEVDVDFVLHGETGPASKWALNADIGDFIQICAPGRGFEGECGGYEWKPPADVGQVLLIADETALPAAAGIIEMMAAWPRPPATQAFLEVPEDADRLDLPRFDGLDLHWLVRDAEGRQAGFGELMVQAAGRARLPTAAAVGPADTALADVDIDQDVLWDRAEQTDSPFYAWVAGETGAVSQIRQFLIKDKAIDRRQLNLMGYWRQGRIRE